MTEALFAILEMTFALMHELTASSIALAGAHVTKHIAGLAHAAHIQ